MAQKGSAKSCAATWSSISDLPTSLKLSSDGGCQLADNEKSTIAKQIRDAGGREDISLEDPKLVGVVQYPFECVIN